MSSQLELWAEELQHQELVTDGNKAEQMLVMHNERVLHMQNCTFEVLQRGQELAQVIISRISQIRRKPVLSFKVCNQVFIVTTLIPHELLFIMITQV